MRDDKLREQQQVTGGSADPQVLQCFWDLASYDQDKRHKAACNLVRALVDSQKQHDPAHRPKDIQPGGSFDQQEGGKRQQRMQQCMQCCSPLMAYGLKRLAKGLASSRQGARQGFAAALAATLAHSAAAAAAAAASGSKQGEGAGGPQLPLPFVSAAGVLALLDACLEVTGSMKGSEQRDALVGRVFGLAALARSGLITAYPQAAGAETEAASSSGNALVLHAVAVVAEQLVGLLQKKVFLRESAAAALVELLQPLGTEQMQQVLSQTPKLASLLQASAASSTPEAVYLALHLWHNLPQQQLQHCHLLPSLPSQQAPPPQAFWSQPSTVHRKAVAAAAAAVFSAGHVQQLVPALLASTASHPRLHPVWGCLLALLVPNFTPIKLERQQAHDTEQQRQQQRSGPDPQQLSNFWQKFVEGACLGSSHERKALALQLLQLLLPVMTPETVPVLLSKQLLGCLATALRDKESYLHASAKKCMDRLSTCADHNLVVQGHAIAAARLRLAVAAALQFSGLQQVISGKTKGTTQQLLASLDPQGVARYVQQLLGEFVAAVRGASDADGAANGAANGNQDSSDDEEEMQNAAADNSKAKQLLEQLVAALRLSAASNSTLERGLLFLAAEALLQLPQVLDSSSLSTSAAAGAAKGAHAADSMKKGKEKDKVGSDKAAAAAPPVLPDADDAQVVQEVLQLAASLQPQPSVELRHICAARLVSLLHSLQHRAISSQQEPQQQQQQTEAKDGDNAKESKKHKKARQRAEHEQATAAARSAAHQQAESLTVRVLQVVAAAQQQLPGVQFTAAEDIQGMVEQLQHLESAVLQHFPQAQQQPQQQGRVRSVLQLVRQLQLQLLAGGLSAEAAGSVVDDLEIAVVKGLGMPSRDVGIDKTATAALDTNSGSSGSDDEQIAMGADSVSKSGSDGTDGDTPAWQDMLLDLLIALLSTEKGAESGPRGGAGVLVPTAPLREACEAVFRAFAEDITGEGLSDMLRVLSQRASEVLKPHDEEDDGVEMEIDGSDAAAADDSASDGPDSVDADDEQQEGDIESEREEDYTTTAVAEASRGAAANGDNNANNSDASDEGLDDDAMMRLDSQLGAAVRAMLQRGGGSAKERSAQLLALQLRVASLLEEWVKKCPRSPLVLQVVLPLLRALVSASGTGGDPTLAARLAAIINKQLSKCKPAIVGQLSKSAVAAATAAGAVPAAAADQLVTLDQLQADTRKVLYYSSRDRDPRVAAAAGQALLVLLAAAADAGGAAAAIAQETAARAFTDFFTKKKTRLQKQWCEQLLSRCPEAVVGGKAKALQVLLQTCSKPRNESMRAKAVLLLPLLLRAGQQQQQQRDLLLLALQQQQGQVAAALGAAVLGPYKAKDQHAAAVKTVVQFVQAAQKLSGQDKRLAELLGGETVRELGKAVVVVKAAGVAHRVEGQLDRLVEVAGLQQLVASAKPDPVRLALLKKTRAAVVGSKGAGKGQQGKNQATPALEAQQQPKQQKKQQQKKQQQQELQENEASNTTGKKDKSKEGKKADIDKGQQQQAEEQQQSRPATSKKDKKRKQDKHMTDGKKKQKQQL